MVSIRRYTAKGSTTVDYLVEEAAAIIREARSRGALVVDEEKDVAIDQLTPDIERVLIVDPIAGG